MSINSTTLRTDYELLLTLFCDELKTEYTRLLETVDVDIDENSIMTAKTEANYHIKTHENVDQLSKRPLNKLLPPTYKLLTDRTLDMLYEHIFNRFIVIRPERALILSEHILSPGLHKFLKIMIFTSDEVNKIMMPIVLDLMSYVEKEVSRLDKIPYVEQKTHEWLRIRSNMISASVAGYFDAEECGCGMSKEYGQIKEKSGLQPGKSIGWGSGSIRHGMTFEDLSGALYNSFYGLTCKEYGIIPDKVHPCIGASPDGIIIDVANRDNWMSLRKLGRMREIKNPTSRLINQRVPDTYYWQMIQQMYVCRLPLCDFIQTSFSYPNNSTPEAFICDTLAISQLQNVETWQDLIKLLNPVEHANDIYVQNTMSENILLEKLDWASIINNIGRDILLDKHTISELNNIITKYVINNWDIVSKIPFANVNKSGEIKGILWCFTKPDTLGGTDFEVLFMDPSVAITTTLQIKSYYDQHSRLIIENGFRLESTYYWACKKYLDFEVEYNQVLYESPKSGILNRLLSKWSLVESIRNAQDIGTKEQLYNDFYPNAYSDKKSETKLGRINNKKTWGYTKRTGQMTNTSSSAPELDLS